ncbi:MAG: hypothetical protein JJU05_13485 [Verrucomicrobia bacterium]|nr:hypothetical protein [Verrucomicrobiota bacterium]MCH8527448.1 hypothetical protein [Kiritimatiellia bacterium]
MKYFLTLLIFLIPPAVSSRANDSGRMEITTAHGRGADAHVSGAEPGLEDRNAELNYGKEPEMIFKGSPNINYHTAVYLRFDLSTLEGRRIRNATLRVHTTDGESPAVDRVHLHHSSTDHHSSRFADIRIAADFDDLVNARKLLVSAEFPWGDRKPDLDGLEAGIGFEQAWRTDNAFNQILERRAIWDGWKPMGQLVQIRGDVNRPLARELHAERGTLWLAGFMESTNAARITRVSFGALEVSLRRGSPMMLNWREADIPSRDGMNLFVVRLDFDPTGNRMWLWSNPDLTAGKPPVDTANAHSVQKSQRQSINASLFGLKCGVEAGPRPGVEGGEGLTQLGGDWSERDITWRNAPGGFANSLEDRVASGQVYHLYTQNLQTGRQGLALNISAPKLTWYLNHNRSGMATLILQGWDDRNLNLASKEHPLLPPPMLILETEE